MSYPLGPARSSFPGRAGSAKWCWADGQYRPYSSTKAASRPWDRDAAVPTAIHGPNSKVILRCAPTNPLYKVFRARWGSMAVLFVSHASRDDAMAVARSIKLFTLYRKQKGQTELHVFQMGAHGFVNKGGGADHYLDRLEEWLTTNTLLTKPAN